MSKSKNELEKLKESLGGELSAEERAYLEKLESELKGKINYEDQDQVEAEIRRREQERIRKTFKPKTPLFTGSGEKTNNMKTTKSSGNDTEQRQSYQNDPRYREYYERLRQARGQAQTTPAEDEVEAISMDDLEKRGYPAAPARPASSQRPPLTPAPTSQVNTNATTGLHARRETPASGVAKPKYSDVASGAIMRLDDGSVAIYKDAVSGKDYALFYFLEPNGTVAPRGIFLQQYDAKRIGHLPEPLFAEMRDAGRWERDAIIFHLERYDFATHVHKVAAHQEGRKPAPGQSSGSPASDPENNDTAADADIGWDEAPAPESPREMLERGRVFKISFGGRAWEAVYWGKDEMGQVVAHDTNREWQLMHLDLDRFKDSMEYGELLSGDRLKEVEASLLRKHR